MIRIAVVTNINETWIEFSTEKFKELLKLYLEETGSVDEAFERIIEDLRRETKYH